MATLACHTDRLSEILGVILGDRHRGLVMVLQGYFDESARAEGSEPISVAGYIFKPQGYKHFCRKWSRMLLSGPKPTTHFHMTHLYARTYEYEGWSVDDRAEMLRQAVDAVRKHMYCGISVLFSQSEFERMAPPDWAESFGSIYTAACQMVLRTTAFWMDENRNHDPIAYVFESGHNFWNEANAVLIGITRGDPELKRLYRHLSHTAIDKTAAYGLQAADMLAWIMTRMIVGAPDNHTMRAFAPIIVQLVAGQNQRYQAFHPTGDLLRRFFVEQATNAEEGFALLNVTNVSLEDCTTTANGGAGVYAKNSRVSIARCTLLQDSLQVVSDLPTGVGLTELEID